MVRTPIPVSPGRKRQMGIGVAINVCAGVGLIGVGLAQGFAPAVLLGVVEGLFAAFVLRTYMRTPVHSDSD
ncbi:MAG TPA: hypothetical protein VNC61_10990 [Acidimicrobiales bacterium]|nr:hypothetical protein [Acidimicrobiales bacterium]